MITSKSKAQKDEEGRTAVERLYLERIRKLEQKLSVLESAEKPADLYERMVEIESEADPECKLEDGSQFELFSIKSLMNLQRAKYSHDHLRDKLRKITASCRYRRLVRVKEEQIAAVDRLGEKYKNFSNFLHDMVVPQLHVQSQTGQPLRLPNCCLVGEPGIGKTAFLTALMSALNIGGKIFDASTVQNSAVLNGLTRTYGNADVGLIFSSMLLGRTDDGLAMPANTMFCIDEVEKMGYERQLGAALDLLLALLERQTARRFVDACVTELPLNLEHLNWCFTANSTHEMSAPLRSRIIEVEVPAPTEEQALEIAASIFEEEIARLRGKVKLLPDLRYSQLEQLVRISPRQQKQVLQMAIAKAVHQGAAEISIPNLEKKSTVRMGFV